MIWPDYSLHDDIVANRLLLAVVDDNETAYQDVLSEIDCPECLRRVITALVCNTAFEWLTVDGHDPADSDAKRKALEGISHNLSVLLDDLAAGDDYSH